MKYKKLDFQIFGDHRGSLISLEGNKNIPFEIKRVYYIFNAEKNIQRGFHAHKNLEQVMICINGSCDILLDDGKEKTVINLKNRNEGLLVKKMTWREIFNFSEDCVLMVLASENYDEEDYIRDYEKFLNWHKK
jgi:dTDP-4-dehydrorhamnose 3,5-epimerase-like enzyme